MAEPESYNYDLGPYDEQPVVPSANSTPANSAETASGESTDAKSADDESTDAESVDGESADDDQRLLNALKSVIDPELMVNIVDLGLIYDVEQTDGKVAVDMTLTSPACPVGPQLMQQSKMALEGLDDVEEATIKLVMSPPWSPDRMTDDARDQLGIF